MKLHTVTVNWNGYSLTQNCISSLLRAGLKDKQLIVVDNGSSDGSPQRLNQFFGDKIIQITNPENQGYVLAINQGIKRAMDLGADWIFVINNDAFVSETFFKHLIPIAEEGRYEILGPAIFYASKPQRIWYLGEKIIDGTLLTRDILHSQVSATNLPSVIEVDFVSGCGMLIKREVFERIGLFDPVYEMYAEEADFCWRARQAGFRLACVPQARMWHIVSASASQDKPRTRYLKTRNQIWFYRKYAQGKQKSLMFLFSLVKILILCSKDIISLQGQLLRADCTGWLDGWFTSAPYFAPNQ